MRHAVAAILAWLLSGTAAHALEWRLGVAYASGLSDVSDFYEDTLRRAGFDADVEVKFPLGVAASFIYDWPGGMRADFGLGPAFLIGGDIEHSEVPLSATLGYNFMRYSHASPYVRGGLVYHLTDGDLYSSASPGVFAAVGVDFTHFTLELAADRSQVEFDSLSCDASGASCQRGTTELHTYEVLASFYWRFRLDRR